ncbi:3-deoxy-D-manno-octulosonic acid transferase [Yoonia litorea]|uniref:3-deoxy-D-manno-octulosonic acid transferase n=1 Tax=Yoonia litorea TaxID=1123755 RepID=UPI0013F4CBB7|nr:glycosyltransferase N-terminal domain-containing protein [Yoonia litorea]
MRPLLPAYLKRRVARGKDSSDRWREKLAEPSSTRPSGALIWLHAVGLGEVMALRSVIAHLSKTTDAYFLVTSTSRGSAEVFTQELPKRTQHQLLPLDSPTFVKRFLDHWRPDLVIWAEQEIWPGFVFEAHSRGLPQVLINARMDRKSFESRRRVKWLFRAALSRLRFVSAQDEVTARHLRQLGSIDVTVDGSLKPAAPPLPFDQVEYEAVRGELKKGRFIWVLGSSHLADETVALAAHEELLKTQPDAILVIVPRFPDRASDVAAAAAALGNAVHVENGFGKLGLWYRLADAVMMGGTFSDVEGHNPWEPARLGRGVFHGPKFANFAPDYAALQKCGGAMQVSEATELADLLASRQLGVMGAKAESCAMERAAELLPLFARLEGLIDETV